MSSKEKCVELINRLTDAQAAHIVTILETMVRAFAEIEANAQNAVAKQFREPNETTYAAMEDAESHASMHGPYSTVEELKKELDRP